MFKKLSILFVGLLFLCLSLQSCKSKSGSGDTQSADDDKTYPVVKNDAMVVYVGANPDILNPILSTDGYSREVTSLVFDTLVSFNVQTGEPEGRLAESWKVSDDGLTYEFKIRKNAVFHDGKPVTSEDVKFSFDTIKDPKVNAAPLQSYFSGLLSTEIVDAQTVRFKMKEIYFRNLIVLGLTEILPKHIYGKGDFNTSAANRSPVGSGPYQFVKWDSGRLIEMKRFPDFWGKNVDAWKDRFNFNKILVRIITEDSVAVMAVKKGEVDTLEPTASQYTKDFGDPSIEQKFYKLKFQTEDGNGYGFIGWNLKNPLFQSKKVRQALAYAMPREEINKKVFGGLRNLSVGPFPQGSAKVDPSVKPIPFDLAKAVALLEEEGWVDRDGDKVVDKNGKKFAFELLFTQGTSDNERIALIYQQSLKTLGIEMNIRTLEWTVFLKQITEGKFDAVMMSWGSSLDSDPFQIWHSSQAAHGGSNRISYANKEVDQILETARKTLDKDKRIKLYQEFSKIMADEAPYLFTLERPSLLIVNKRFKNVLPIGKLGTDSSRWFTPQGHEKYKE